MCRASIARASSSSRAPSVASAWPVVTGSERGYILLPLHRRGEAPPGRGAVRDGLRDARARRGRRPAPRSADGLLAVARHRVSGGLPRDRLAPSDPADPVVGTLNLYRTEPGPGPDAQVALLVFFAEHAASAVRTPSSSTSAPSTVALRRSCARSASRHTSTPTACTPSSGLLGDRRDRRRRRRSLRTLEKNYARRPPRRARRAHPGAGAGGARAGGGRGGGRARDPRWAIDEREPARTACRRC